MTPDELQRATSEVEKQVSKLNEELTKIIADGIMHRFAKYGEVKLSASDEYRIKTMKRAGTPYSEIMQAIQTKTKGLDAEIRKLFKQTATNLGNVKMNSYVKKKANEPIKQNESDSMVKRVKTGAINEKDLTANQKRILEDVYRRTQNEITDFYGKTAYNGVKVYQQAVDEAIRKIQAGIGWQKAVRDAIKEVAKKGMYVEYPSGRIDTIETAILRAVRTGVNQANSKLVLERAAAEGQDLILVSSHMDARPSHQVWQGKIYSLSGQSKKYPEFYSATGYGTAEGLCGINCRHTIMIYYPGVTRNSFKRYNTPANRRRYEISQKQRKMERDIRKTSNRKSVLEGSKKNTNDPELKRQLNEEIQKETEKLRLQKKAYSAFVESNQMKKVAIRTYTPKYDAVELKKAVKIYRKNVVRIPQIPASSVSEKIRLGEYSIKLSKQQYDKHVVGTAKYEEYLNARVNKGGNPQSRITISETEAQKIIETKAGTGIIKVDRNGNPRPQEQITCDSIVGQYYFSGRYINTNKAVIHYSKKGAHLVPIRGEHYD